MSPSRKDSAPSTPRESRLPPLSSPCHDRLPLFPAQPTVPSLQQYRLSTPPGPLLHPQLATTMATPDPSQPSITLAPLVLDTPLQKPNNVILPSIRELFSPFPPEYVKKTPANPIPDVSTLFAMLNPVNRQEPPLCDDVADQAMRAKVCAACGNPNASVRCPKCHLVHYCSMNTCYTQDYDHPSACVQFCNYAVTVYAQQYNHTVRLELVKVLECLYRRQRTQNLLELALWHSNEMFRLSRKRDPVHINLEFPFFLLRAGDNDGVVSFVRYWARKTTNRLPDSELYSQVGPGHRIYPVDISRYDDALAEGFPCGTVPLTHIVSLCVVKARIIASVNARVADERRKSLWESNFGKKLSAATGARLEDFLLRAGRPKESDSLQFSMFGKYLELIRARNPMMEHVIRDFRMLQNGCTNSCAAAVEEAQQIWNSIGDLFTQLPGYPHCVF